jgi:fibronectin-binding autotransporter adhesin
LPGIVELDLAPHSTTISADLRVVTGQRARIVGSTRSSVTFSHAIVVANGGTLTLDGGGSVTFSGGVTVETGGTLTLNSPLTVVGSVHIVAGQHSRIVVSTGNTVTFSGTVTVSGALTLSGGGSVAFSGGVTVETGGTLTLNSPLMVVINVQLLATLANAAGHVTFASGGVTLADAHGATLGTAAGAFPGDVQLTHLSTAGQSTFHATGASATVSRDAHGAMTSSRLAGVFTSTSGPCALASQGRCVQRGSYRNGEHCSIDVAWGGTLGPCPRFNTEACCDHLTIDGHNYDGTSCPQGVNVASGSTITWHTDGSDTSSGWEICFRAN